MHLSYKNALYIFEMNTRYRSTMFSQILQQRHVHITFTQRSATECLTYFNVQHGVRQPLNIGADFLVSHVERVYYFCLSVTSNMSVAKCSIELPMLGM